MITGRRPLFNRLLVPLVGFLALVWFLIRVIPKPSRAAYPCQRAAFPLASAFVLWVVGLFSSGWLMLRGKTMLADKRWLAAGTCLVLALVMGTAAWMMQPSQLTLAAPAAVNQPIGQAAGIFPGRVVWYHDRDATDWDGPGFGHWWEPEHTNQAVVEEMLSATIGMLAGEADETQAWDAIFRHFNLKHGGSEVGYSPGEKIMIKINLVGCHYLPGWGGTDPDSYDLTSNFDYMNTSPQVMLALLRRLVYVVGVNPADITMGDPLSLFPNQYHEMLAAEFPDVNYLDHEGGTAEHPRLAAQDSSVPLHWSGPVAGTAQDYIPESYVQATYFINLANFKSHQMAGVTLCAKNHYGSFTRYPVQAEYFDMHASLATLTPEAGRYRALVDLMGHSHLGGKTLLYLVDGLYSGCHPQDSAPRRWYNEPFGGDWTSSLLASLDAVAIESVGLDLMQLEGDPRQYPQMAGADDYLIEAALADAPPSGVFYDPDHDGQVTRLQSLGVHEHWNDPVNMQYSRNLGIGDGIELVKLNHLSEVPASKDHFYSSCYPNPFNPRTTIHFELAEAGLVSLCIFDISGALVSNLVQEDLPPGSHERVWLGRHDDGRQLPSGLYYYRLQQGETRESGKMTLIR